MMKEDQPGSSRILIVDDEPMTVQLLELILTKERDDRIVMATSGQEGLATAEKEQPDLIIIRIMMHKLDGFEVCRRLKQNPALANIPVLLQAAMALDRVYPTAKEIGAAGYLYQPFQPKTLLEARDIVLQGGQFFPMPYPARY